ncbi:MAG: LamB/YcsF family protein, partial [Paracoccaceae bacterium]
DAAMLEIVTSANLCCGAHAGGPQILRETMRAAVANGVTIGAHPGYPDPANFGRFVIAMTPAEVTAMVTAQLHLAREAAGETGATITYVKPHGALYNLAATDRAIADAIAMAIAAVDPALIFLGLAGSAMLTAGHAAGLTTKAEAFADRAYDAKGQLLPRSQPGAVLHDADRVAARAVAMVRDGAVTSHDGQRIALQFDSLCLHGDTPGAVTLARAVRAALQAEGITIRPFAGMPG